MPKYLVTSGSHFEPFTYDELVKPVAAAQQAHEQAQDLYDALEMYTAALDRYISSEEGSGDEEARKLYDNYMNRLNALQDDLYNNGYSAKTKRGLAEARKLYASDISRVSKAIEARQNRSAEYWKYKHEHPDMIMADDPGLSGLDKYLDNELYGQDYYQYSGSQFESEIASAAKARADEIFSAPQYRDNPYMAGYKQRIDREGFTDEEINNAVSAIRNGGAESLDVPSRILYDILLGGLDATGAYDKVSDDEYDRLIEYGRRGLSHAIGKTTFTDIQDREWISPKAGAGSGAGSAMPTGNGYALNNPITSFQTPGYTNLSKSFAKQNSKYQDGDVRIILPDDSSDYVSSYEDMTSRVYNPEVRKETRSVYGGLDVAMTPKELEKATESTPVVVSYNGVSIPVKVKASDGKVQIYSDGKLNEALTEDFNKRRELYNQHIKDYADKNSGMNFEKYALSPSEEQKIREKYGISPLVDTDDIFAIQRTKDRVGIASEGVLVNSNVGMDAVQATLANTIYDSYNKGLAHLGGKIEKDSKYAFYPVEEGRYGKSSKKKDAITDITKIFENGDVEKNLNSITFTPEDIAQGAGDGRPFFRFISKSAPGEYTADAEMLGNITWNTLKGGIAQPPYNSMSMCDAVDLMMQPILNPQEMFTMTPEQKDVWINTTLSILNGDDMGRYKQTGYLSGPMITINGELATIAPDDIVRYPQFQTKLYNDITAYINDMLSNARDIMQNQHPQHTGNTSTNAPTYLP